MASNPLVISASGGFKELPLVTSIGATGSDAAIPSEQATREALVEPWTDIDRNGFVSHAQTSLSFNDTTYVFTLTDTGSGWQYYRAGDLCTISGNKTVILTGTPPTAGIYYVYIDATDGTLTASQTVWTLQDSKIPVAIVIWNNANTPKYWLCDERHTCLIDRRTHLYLHSTRGTQLVSGATLSGYTVKPSSPADTDNTMAIAAATIADEDLLLSLASLSDGNGTDTVYSVWFKSSGAWTWEASAVPFRYTASGYIQYDNAGTMTQGAASKYYNWYLVCTNVSGAARFAWFPGKSEFSAAADAYAEQPSGFDWSGIPLVESVVVWQVTFETSNSYTTKGKCRLNRAPQRINLTVTTAINQSNLAAGVATDVTAFNGKLSSADTTVQKALETLDDHHHDIIANTTIYVATTGSDTTGNGSSGAPYATIPKALSAANEQRIRSGYTVTIQVDDGIYTHTSALTTIAAGITVVGKNTYTKTMSSVQSSSGSAGAYSLVLNLDSVTNITTSDDCIISAAYGGTNPTYVMGYWEVTNVDTGNNRITVLSTHRGGVPSGSVTATVTIIKTKLSFTSVTGISLTDFLGGSLSKCGIMGNNTAATNGIFLANASILLTAPVGIRSFGQNGILCSRSSSVAANAVAISGNGGDGVRNVASSSTYATSTIISGNAGNGIFCSTCGSIGAVLSTISGNVGHGVSVVDDGCVSASPLTITGNSGHGIYCANAGQITTTSATIAGTSAVLAEKYGYVNVASASLTGTVSPAVNTQGNEYGYIDS